MASEEGEIHETHCLMRLTDKMSEEIHNFLNNPSVNLDKACLTIIPKTSRFNPGPSPNGSSMVDVPQFRLKFGETQSTASLVDLPCLVESYKTLDHVNIFKSNNVSQMIVAHPNNEMDLEQTKDFEKNFRKITTKELKPKEMFKETKAGSKAASKEKRMMTRVRYESLHGLTPPTKFIRQRFFRKKIMFEKGKVTETERVLMCRMEAEVPKGILRKRRKRTNNNNDDKEETDSMYMPASIGGDNFSEV